MAADAEMLQTYIAAFNRGDTATYAAFYADDVVLCNGGGTVLRGRDAITAFYSGVRQRLDRTIEVEGVIAGDNAMTALLRSEFTALEDAVELGGSLLNRGDRMLLRSMALYELVDSKFQAIRAISLERRFLRQGEEA